MYIFGLQFFMITSPEQSKIRNHLNKYMPSNISNVPNSCQKHLDIIQDQQQKDLK